MAIFAHYQYINHAYVVDRSEKVPRPAIIYKCSLKYISTYILNNLRSKLGLLFGAEGFSLTGLTGLANSLVLAISK